MKKNPHFRALDVQYFHQVSVAFNTAGPSRDGMANTPKTLSKGHHSRHGCPSLRNRVLGTRFEVSNDQFAPENSKHLFFVVIDCGRESRTVLRLFQGNLNPLKAGWVGNRSNWTTSITVEPLEYRKPGWTEPKSRLSTPSSSRDLSSVRCFTFERSWIDGVLYSVYKSPDFQTCRLLGSRLEARTL